MDILNRQRGGDTGDLGDGEEEEEFDSDDDEDPLDLADRLRGVDLEDAEATWSALTAEERRQFSSLLSSGDVTSVLPDWSPWWSYKVQRKKISEINEPEDRSYVEKCPKIVKNIPEFSSLCLNPSEVLKYGLMNILYGYAYAVRYFHGDYTDSASEFVHIIQLLATNLGGRNYEHADAALEAAASEVSNHQHLAVSLKFSRDVKKDVLDIVRGPSGSDSYYVLAAVSDMVEMFKRCAKNLKQKNRSGSNRTNTNTTTNLPAWFNHQQYSPELSSEQVKKHVKKLEFYLSWSRDHHGQLSDYFH